MDQLVQTKPPRYQSSDLIAAWEMVTGQLRIEMSRVKYETWVANLQPVSYQNGIFTLSTQNAFARDWVISNLDSRITRLLEGLFHSDVRLSVIVSNQFAEPAVEIAPEPLPIDLPPAEPEPVEIKRESKNRKVMLQKAYGSKRASIIQPERGMFVTLYFFSNWTPLVGHSAMAVILAARSMCYWNPMTGELRNTIETEMGELAKRASVSLRTVKDVLNNELVKRYFLRYKIRRMMTANGVRTAGILLQVRMDDPLTPEDQQEHNLTEDLRWYSSEFELFEEEDE